MRECYVDDNDEVATFLVKLEMVRGSLSPSCKRRVPAQAKQETRDVSLRS